MSLQNLLKARESPSRGYSYKPGSANFDLFIDFKGKYVADEIVEGGRETFIPLSGVGDFSLTVGSYENSAAP